MQADGGINKLFVCISSAEDWQILIFVHYANVMKQFSCSIVEEYYSREQKYGILYFSEFLGSGKEILFVTQVGHLNLPGSLTDVCKRGLTIREEYSKNK